MNSTVYITWTKGEELIVEVDGKEIKGVVGVDLRRNTCNVLRMQSIESLIAPIEIEMPEEVGRHTKANKVDKGKIIALWDSGNFTQQQIAEEVGCSVTTVSKTINTVAR